MAWFRTIRTWLFRAFVLYLLVRAYAPGPGMDLQSSLLPVIKSSIEGVKYLSGQKAMLDLAPERAADLAALQASRANDMAAFKAMGGLNDPLVAYAAAAVEVTRTDIAGVPCRVYTPVVDGKRANSDNLRPGMVYMHGGGWAMLTPDFVHKPLYTITAKSKVVIVSVDYRLAPEHKFPAGLDDSQAVLEWVIDNGHQLGIDTSTVFVGGDSAGGNLALAALLRLHDTRLDAMSAVKGQVLVYPAADVLFHYPSATLYREGYFLSLSSMVWFARMYLSDPREAVNPYVSPLFASEEQLSAMPRTLMVTAQYDVLLDGCDQLAARMADAGVDITKTQYNATMHGFFSFDMTPAAAESWLQVAQFIGDTVSASSGGDGSSDTEASADTVSAAADGADATAEHSEL